MIIDGVFLALVGAAQVTLEVLAHFLGVGPYASILDRSPYTIGWVEAHGLAAMIGVLSSSSALATDVGSGTRSPSPSTCSSVRRTWCSGRASSTSRRCPLGKLGTAAHVLFATAQAWSLVVSRLVKETAPTQRSLDAEVVAGRSWLRFLSGSASSGEYWPGSAASTPPAAGDW